MATTSEPSDPDALLVLSDQLEELGLDAGARLLRDVADRMERQVRLAGRLGGDGWVGLAAPTEKPEAIRRAYDAVSLFGHTSGSHHERLGALLEAVSLYCEECRNVDPGLMAKACQYAAHLTELRRRHDPEWQRKMAELRHNIAPTMIIRRPEEG